MRLTALFISNTRNIYKHLLRFSERSVKKKLEFFRHFAYVSNYLQAKTFVWKRDYVIFSKLKMLWR